MRTLVEGKEGDKGDVCACVLAWEGNLHGVCHRGSGLSEPMAQLVCDP